MSDSGQTAYQDNGASSSDERGEQAPSYQRIHDLMTQQPYGVLCTQGEGQPYGSLIAFVVNPQLDAVVFTTPVETFKFRLLSACEQVALVVDNRATFQSDKPMYHDALTAIGRAIRLHAENDIAAWKQRLIRQHPRMKDFICAPSSAMFRIDIERYTYVSGLQEVHHWRPSKMG